MSVRQKAFTLIELLVVITIVALLIAMLLPALKKARDSGRTMICLANLREMTLATTIYATDNGVYLPLLGAVVYPPTGEIAHREWTFLLGEYMPGHAGYRQQPDNGRTSFDFLICPEAPEHKGTWYQNVGYGYNAKTFAAGRGMPKERRYPSSAAAWWNLALVSPEEVTRPSEIVIFGDNKNGVYPAGHHPTYVIDCMCNGITPLNRIDVTATRRHLGNSVAALSYPDGHAAADGDLTKLDTYRYWTLSDPGPNGQW